MEIVQFYYINRLYHPDLFTFRFFLFFFLFYFVKAKNMKECNEIDSSKEIFRKRLLHADPRCKCQRIS